MNSQTESTSVISVFDADQLKRKLKCSHIALTICCGLLFLFALASNSVLLSATSSKIGFSNGSNNLDNYILSLTIILIFFAVTAVFASFKKNSCLLQMYQIACLFFLVVFSCMLLGISYIELQHLDPTVVSNLDAQQQITRCYSPNNYFEYKIVQTVQKAKTIFCSEKCPCPQYSKVQDCPGWNPSSLDSILSEMESQFSCSGWCKINSQENPFIFSQKKRQTPKGTCHDLWGSWITGQWKMIHGSLGLLTFVILLNVIFSYVRTGLLMKQD